MINVYFTASTSFDGKYLQNYQKILDFLKNNGCNIISGEQIVSKKLLSEDKKIAKKKIYEREIDRVKEADCVIAEISHPSHGVGVEIVYALNNNKPVLGLVYKQIENKLSPLLEGNTADNFFLERYDLDKLPYALKNFIKYIDTLKKRQGKLIVIEGGDGSGKTVQAKMLVEYFKKINLPVKYIDFPQYYSSFHGKTVAKFLRGEFGRLDQVSPYLASLAYSLDRASIKEEVEDFLNMGGNVVANRYATSNMTHQGAKIKDDAEREKFLNWVYELEYKAHKIPKENLVVYLYVPYKIAFTLSKKQKDKTYLKNKPDIHEADMEYRMAVEKMYKQMAKKYPHWVTVNCVKDGKILSPLEIHKKIIGILKEKRYV